MTRSYGSLMCNSGKISIFKPSPAMSNALWVVYLLCVGKHQDSAP